MIKVKEFISSLKLRWSDLFLLIAAGSFAFFVGLSQTYMGEMDPAKLNIPNWIVIVLGVLMCASFGAYLYYELGVRKEKYNRYILMGVLSLILINTIVIMVQPEYSTQDVIVRYRPEDNPLPGVVGKSYSVLLYVSVIHRFFFMFELIGTLLLIYSAFFIFSKRITSLKFIEWLGYGILLVGVFLAIYSYATEAYKYIQLPKFLLDRIRGVERSDLLYDYTVQSFFDHRNPLGMTYMLCIIFCFVVHTYRKYWWHYLAVVFFFINLCFTFNKTGLILSALLILIYWVYRLIMTFKENKKRNTIVLSCIALVVFLAVLLIGVPYVSKGKVFGKIYAVINEFAYEGASLKYREYIWDNAYQLLRDGWWVIGRGFGIMNVFLKPMNNYSHQEPVIPTHSGYLNVLAEGGIIFFLAYLLLIGYVGYVTVKCFKKDKDLTISISLGVLAFLLYSFVETNHYLMYLFAFPLMVLFNQKEKEAE